MTKVWSTKIVGVMTPQVFKSWKGVPWKVQFHTCKKPCLTLCINLKCIFAIPTNWILISLRKSVPEMGKPTKLHA